MDQSKIFVKNEAIGSVFRCQHGIIHVNLYGVSLHFNEAAFLSFTRMAQEASSKLMDEHLADLVRDRGIEREE